MPYSSALGETCCDCSSWIANRDPNVSRSCALKAFRPIDYPDFTFDLRGLACGISSSGSWDHAIFWFFGRSYVQNWKGLRAMKGIKTFGRSRGRSLSRKRSTETRWRTLDEYPLRTARIAFPRWFAFHLHALFGRQQSSR